MNRTIEDIIAEECVGCGACVNACPKKCIEMRMDEEGFSYPHIDKEQCVNCGKCYQACPTVQVQRMSKRPRVLAMINRSSVIRRKSSSGGVFYELAKSMIEFGGVVCAAAFDSDMGVKHIFVDKLEDIEKCMRSKYVQSDLGDCFRQAEQYLQSGTMVLFVGTPCQVYGLTSYLGRDWEKLFLVDLICHGVPSPMLWKEYIDEIGRDGTKINQISFRDMSIEGWKNFGMKIQFSDGSAQVDTQDKNVFMQGFLKGFYNRKSCYDCKFKGLNRKSDITLGDFWTVDKYISNFNDNQGTSLVFVNSEKGKRFIKTVRKSFFIKKVTDTSAALSNTAYGESFQAVDVRRRFYKKYKSGKSMRSIVELELKKRRDR